MLRVATHPHPTPELVRALLLPALVGLDGVAEHLGVEAVMMHASTLEPEPRSLKIPVNIAVQTMSRASAR